MIKTASTGSKLRQSRLLDLIRTLQVVWLLLVVWFEYGSFHYSLWDCRWPDASFTRGSHASHVIVIDDARVRFRPRSFRRALDAIRYHLYHLTLRKNWSFASNLRPDVIVFLGDMLSSGYRIDDEQEYASYVQEFKSIFQMDKSTEVYFAPGNEDVGLRVDWQTASIARSHYTRHFGPLNGWVPVSNHTFVILDAPGMAEEDYQRAEKSLEYDEWQPKPDGAIEFIKSISASQVPNDATHPVVLFSHIPLARPELANCGPLREKGTIHRGIGLNYQNTFGKKTTEFLIEELRPYLIFSGDDRDYCEYTHRDGNSPGGVREVTVKSFSPVQYIKYPGFHLLSVVDSSSLPPHIPYYADKPCLLPDYINIYWTRYLPLALLTLVVILLYRNRRRRITRHRPSLPSHSGDSLLYGSSSWPPLDADIVDGLPPTSPNFGALNALSSSSPRDTHPPPLRTPTFSMSSSTGDLRSGSTTPSLRASLYASSPIDSSFMSTTTSPQLGRDLGDKQYETFDAASSTRRSKAPLRIGLPPTAKNKRSFWRKLTWSWSWTFHVMGRPRRLTMVLPPVWRIFNVFSPQSMDHNSPRKSGWIRTLSKDVFVVFTPAFLLWTLITWRTLM
ncbi:hypothetical protein QCA50_004572 [Cerrena zonata]|uniref:Calcineurin-like phosphoesterase domain-containing protein n=1 Tax=Cerrena zonata TaxID=2478898 RepID=A0AAW0GHV4_9APHY